MNPLFAFLFGLLLSSRPRRTRRRHVRVVIHSGRNPHSKHYYPFAPKDMQ